MNNKENDTEEKKVISIYRIDHQLEELNIDEKSPWENLLDIVEKNYNAEELDLKEKFLDKYDCKCFKLYCSSPIGWKKYVEEFLKEKLTLRKSDNNSILLLIKDKTNKNEIFAIGFGNLAYFTIQKYIDATFGLDILSRIINPNSNIVKLAKGQNVVGSTQGQISIYRQLHSLNDIEDFGRIFQELNATIKKEVLAKFGIATEKEFKNCCAKASFQIKSSITSDTIEKYIDGCKYALTLEKQAINSSRQLDKKKDKDLIAEILSLAITETWNNIKNGAFFDLCHKDFDKYLEAESYQLIYNRSNKELNFDTTLNDLILLCNISEFEDFEIFLRRSKIVSYNGEDKPLTQDCLLNHLFLEYEKVTEEKRQKYFILNGNIYKLEESFINLLNRKIANYKNKTIFITEPTLENWEKTSNENNFNDLYQNKSNYIEVHPYKHNNIELCDLININEKELYLYFVKDGFNGTIRDLSYQIFNTAKIIENDKNSKFEFLNNFYDAFSSNPNYSGRITLSKQQFVDLFNKKSIRYVFAFRDEKNRSLKDMPEQFGSNIAKFALIDLEQKMNSVDNGSLCIEQIKCV